MDQQELARLAHEVAVRPRDVDPWLDLARALVRAEAAAPTLEPEVRARVPLAPLLEHPELQDVALACAGLERLEAGPGFPTRVRHRATGVVLAWVPPVEAWLGGAPDADGKPRGWLRWSHPGTYLAEAPLTRAQARALGLTVEELPGEAPEDADRVAGGLDAPALEAALAEVGLRLPTANEREVAARSGDGRPFPWGIEPGLDELGEVPDEPRRSGPRDLRTWRPRAGAGRFAVGPYGHRHLAGPLREPVREGAGLLLMGSDCSSRRRAPAGERRAWAPGVRAGRGALGAPGKGRPTPAAPGEAPDPAAWPDRYALVLLPEAWEWDLEGYQVDDEDEDGNPLPPAPEPPPRAEGPDHFARELARETCAAHGLHGVPVRTLAKSIPQDDVLFHLPGQHPAVAAVHLTWSVEHDPRWPGWGSYEELDDWLDELERFEGAPWPGLRG